jgi:hypothetical protein
MQKIISLFQRNYDGDRLVRDEVTPGAEWVINGEGIATRKWDGTCCMIKDGQLYKRYDAKHGKTPPSGFIPAQKPDLVTGHWPGWLKVGRGKEDKYHMEAFVKCGWWQDGTYELMGPKINGNKDKFTEHRLVKHGETGAGTVHIPVPRQITFESLNQFFADIDGKPHRDLEGIVWHHPDGRMVKIKKKDFGYKW